MYLIAFILIGLGVIFLLQNTGVISAQIWGIIWPLFLITLGLYIAFISHMIHRFIGRIWKFLGWAEDMVLWRKGSHNNNDQA